MLSYGFTRYTVLGYGGVTVWVTLSTHTLISCSCGSMCGHIYARAREAGRNQRTRGERSPSSDNTHEQIRDSRSLTDSTAVRGSKADSQVSHTPTRATGHGGRGAHKTKVTNKISQDQESRGQSWSCFCVLYVFTSRLSCPSLVHLILALLPHVRHHLVKKKARLLFGAQKSHHGFGVHHVAVKSLRPMSRIDADG